MAKTKNVLKMAFGNLKRKGNILAGARVYLSGPMDFVADRAYEKRYGWRNRLAEFLEQKFGTVVFDPWNKPGVAGLPHYGEEDESSLRKREKWSYANDKQGHQIRAGLAVEFWATVHIDLRMTDVSDFLIAYCPTNIYSVGTVHEIVTARLQHKPVLLVTPPVVFPAYNELEEHLRQRKDASALELLEKVQRQAPLRLNPRAIPSMWYMGILRADYFFDGFGFAEYVGQFGWGRIGLDDHEKQFPPRRPLLPYLEKLNKEIPKVYDEDEGECVEDPEWLIFCRGDEDAK